MLHTHSQVLLFLWATTSSQHVSAGPWGNPVWLRAFNLSKQWDIEGQRVKTMKALVERGFVTQITGKNRTKSPLSEATTEFIDPVSGLYPGPTHPQTYHSWPGNRAHGGGSQRLIRVAR